SEAVVGKPAGISQRHRHGQIARSSHTTARRIRAHSRGKSRWPPGAENLGPAIGYHSGNPAGGSNSRRAPRRFARAPGGSLRGPPTGSRFLRSPCLRGEIRYADRSHWLHRQGLAGQHLIGIAGGGANLPPDSEAEIQSRGSALRKNGGGFAGLRSAL